MELSPSPGINLIHGSNGSGKTTVLEACYMLARGRSFRGIKSAPLITTGEKELQVVGEYLFKDSSHRVGLRKAGSETEIRMNGEDVKRLSQLASVIPLQILTPQSYQLLDRGPEFRRKFIEWGVFHVEHSYSDLMKRYLRILYQRNAALKSAPKMAATWDKEFADTGEKINQKRCTYLEQLTRLFSEELNILLGEVELTMKWRSGWRESASLQDQLKEMFATDQERKFTSIGPHRADLDIKINKIPVAQFASRGQQKLIIVALTLAQLRLASELTQANPVMLIDDLAAELDQNNRERVFSRFKETGSQLFLTSTEKNLIPDMIDTMFHVEHGELIP